jgi:IS30 family transposase
MIDMNAKGRGNHIEKGLPGEQNYFARLTEPHVIEIRRLHTEGTRQRDIADKFGVCLATVSNIIARRTWSHI